MRLRAIGRLLSSALCLAACSSDTAVDDGTQRPDRAPAPSTDASMDDAGATPTPRDPAGADGSAATRPDATPAGNDAAPGVDATPPGADAARARKFTTV